MALNFLNNGYFAGKVGIGTESPDQQLEILYPSYINKDTVEGLLRLTGQSNTENAGDIFSAGVGIEFYNKWTGGLPYSIGRISARASQSFDGGLQFDVSQNTGAGQTNFITAMTILDTGNVGIGTTSPGSKLTVVAPFGGIGTDFQISGGSGFGTKNVKIEIPGYGDGLQITSVASSTLDDNAITFYQDANKRGSIVVNATSTSYNTTSDYRLKENKEDISDAIERVKSLKPVKFNWISEPNQPKVDGFYAHELAEIVPQAVTGKKDALDYENKPDYQSIDQSKIVPLLTAALQQAIDKIEALEQRIQLIENK
jgi:hypothetical protein